MAKFAVDYRDSIAHVARLSVVGAIAAYGAKAIGVQNSVLFTATIGAGLGWGACWAYQAWFSQPKGVERPGEAGLTRMASQRAAMDNSIRATMPANEKIDAERKG